MGPPLPFQVAIVSYNRPGTVRRKTLALLARHGIPPSHTTVFVADEAQLALYRAADLDQLARLRIAAPGVAPARNCVHRAFPAGTWLWCLDDDIEDILVRVEERRTQPLELAAGAVTEVFALTARAGLRLWGVAPVSNPFFMAARVTTGLRFVVGCCYGVIVSHEAALLTHVPVKEDYERTLRYYLADGGVVRLNYWAPKTKYYTEPGGLQGLRDGAQEQAATDYLLKTFPTYVRRVKDRRGFAQVALKVIG